VVAEVSANPQIPVGTDDLRARGCAKGASDEQIYPAFERTAGDLATRIPFLLELIGHTTQEVS
jgi:hypothetical protein